jgi:hypothetical protein
MWDRLAGNDMPLSGYYKARAVAAVIIAFFVSCYFAWEEFRYWFTGRETTAAVSDIRDHFTGNRYDNSSSREVWFSFEHEGLGKEVNGFVVIDADRENEFPRGRTLEIEYIGDRFFTARIRGMHNWWSLAFLAASVAAMIGFLVWVYVDMKRVEARRQRRRGGAY